MNKILWPLVIGLLMLSLNLVWMGFSHHYGIFQSYLHNQAAFAFELVGNHWRHPEPWLHDWFFNQDAPYKYRLLGKVPVYLCYKALGMMLHPLPALYYAYLLWCWLFLALVLRLGTDLCWEILKHCVPGVEEPVVRRLALLVLVLCPPLLFAFKFPTHGSPNDLLGYALIALACLSLMREQYRQFVFWMLLAVPCRETNLIMLLPFVMLRKPDWRFRFGTAALVLAANLAYRWLWPGHYNPFTAAGHNLQYPLESLFYLFLVFAPLWLLGLLGYGKLRRQDIENDAVNALVRSFLPATVAVLVISFSLARVREIRIEFILFFYVIPFSLAYLLQRWKMVPILILTVLLALRLWLYFLGGFGGDWQGVFMAYFVVTLLVVGVSVAAQWGSEVVNDDWIQSE